MKRQLYKNKRPKIIIQTIQKLNKNINRLNFNPYGHHSYLQMISTKVKRLEAIAFNDKNPNFESSYDSILDLINYASFYGAYLKKNNGK